MALALLSFHCGGSTPPPPATPSPPPPPPPAPDASAEEHKEVHWSYEGEGAPDHWGDLKPEFAACKDGTSQTPIDIPKQASKGKGLKPLKYAYEPVPVRMINNGHTIQVNNSTPSSLAVGSDRYDLVQFHFHSPSEHTLAGASFDGELHLVHKNSAGALAVVGVFLKQGKKDNKVLAPVFENMPVEPSEVEKTIDATVKVSSLVRPKPYYTYSGSLTTPPCTEGVTWFVLGQPVEVSQAQLDKLRGAFHGPTNRPVQSVGDRQVDLLK